ncbi:SMI1/KNR4 family protein [Litoreibacter albidus]|uniref:SMI1/KNR4 family protein n=1 Tax=Litoreibacter albidus TaxID=670155 RepID=UPI003735C0AA
MALSSNVALIPSLLDHDALLLPLDQVVTRLGVRIPSEYLRLIAPENRAVMFDKSTEIRPLIPNPLTSKTGFQSVLTLFGLSDGDHGILKNFERLNGRIESNYVPIGEDGLGNLYMLDSKTKQIVFWHHECPDGENSPTAFTLVSDDVVGFISGLQPASVERDVNLSAGVKRVQFDF